MIQITNIYEESPLYDPLVFEIHFRVFNEGWLTFNLDKQLKGEQRAVAIINGVLKCLWETQGKSISSGASDVLGNISKPATS
jgi:hypothetical protein